MCHIMAHDTEKAGKAATTPTHGAQAVRRALDVARTVAQLQNTGASLARIARATQLSRSTAFRLLRTLVEERLLEFGEDGSGYRLGPLAHELGLACKPVAEGESGVAWRHAVQSIAIRTRLTSYLMKRSGSEAVCLLCEQGAAVVRAMPMEVGQRVPLGLGSGSLAILSSLEDAEIARILDLHGRRIAQFPAGALSRDTILERVRRTRVQGFAQTSGTVAAGVCGIGVLVPSSASSTRLALTVSAVGDRITQDEAQRLADQIRAIAFGRA